VSIDHWLARPLTNPFLNLTLRHSGDSSTFSGNPSYKLIPDHDNQRPDYRNIPDDKISIGFRIGIEYLFKSADNE
jgi:hypothetical protein